MAFDFVRFKTPAHPFAGFHGIADEVKIRQRPAGFKQTFQPTQDERTAAAAAGQMSQPM